MLLPNLVSLNREHLASRLVLISNRLILTFFVLLVQTYNSQAVVRNTTDTSCASVRSGNWRRRSWSGVKDGITS